MAVTVGLSGGMPDPRGSSPFADQTAAGYADMVIYLCSGTPMATGGGQVCDAPATEERSRELRSALALDGAVAEVEFETQQQTYERFLELFADQPDVVESVTPHMLPASLPITLVEGAPIHDMVRHYSRFQGAEAVVTPEVGGR